MTTFEAIYADGVLRPLSPLPLNQNDRVVLTLRPSVQNVAPWLEAAARVRAIASPPPGILFDAAADIAEDRWRDR